MSGELCFTPAAELASRIRRRDLSPVEVVEAFLGRIEERNGGLGAYVTVIGDEAVLAASAAFERIRPWHGSYDVLASTNVGAGPGKVG